MKEVGRLNLIMKASAADRDVFADAVDKEIQHIADRAATREFDIVTRIPADTEGRVGEALLFVDMDGRYGTRGARYILNRHVDGWYRTTALIKAR